MGLVWWGGEVGIDGGFFLCGRGLLSDEMGYWFCAGLGFVGDGC